MTQPALVRPRTLSEALELLSDAPSGTKLLAGGTDLMVAWRTGAPKPGVVIDLWGLGELRGVARSADRLMIGALTTFSEIIESPDAVDLAPALVLAAMSIGAVQIQNRGTIGGNVANASPAGDSLPVLLAMDATFIVKSIRGSRAVPALDFWLGYRTIALGADEILVRIELPVRPWPILFRKVGTRRAQAISKVVMATSLARDGKTVTEARIAYGSVAPVPLRARSAEAALVGSRLEEPAIERAVAALAGDIAPIDDIRSTRRYRMHVARVILRRALEDIRGTS